MEMKGEQLIPAPQKLVWDALNDPAMLKACVPGCEAITPVAENIFEVLMVARVGPVAAKFKGKLSLSFINPPDSYSLSFEGQGGAAGFAKGSAQVSLHPAGDKLTRLEYDVKANVGGKLAQIGSRLIDAAARKVADDFFKNFNQKVAALHFDEDATQQDEDATLQPVKAAKKEEPKGEPTKKAAGEHHDDDHDHRPAPVPRDPDLPNVNDTTLAFFAAGSLVIFFVSLFVLV